jgi:hypothetical protein
MGLGKMQINVVRFIGMFPDIGQNVLDAYNEVDPFGVYYGEDENPDEYLKYAHSFCQMFEGVVRVVSNLSLYVGEASSFDVIKEIVCRSFPPIMLISGEIGEGRIEKITQAIIANGVNLDHLLGRENRSKLRKKEARA